MIPFDTTQITSPENGCNPQDGAPCHPLSSTAHAPAVAFKAHGINGSDVAYALRSDASHSGDKGDGGLNTTLVAHSLRAEGFDESEDGTGRGTPIVPEIIVCLNSASGHAVPGNSVQDIDKLMCVPPLADCLQERDSKGSDSNTKGGHLLPYYAPGSEPKHHTLHAVRRLTPRECERLQGFKDDYTAIPYRGKTADECPDGPRYKALGNSMAVPCMAWIGRRIQKLLA